MPAFNRHSAQLLKRAIEAGITSPAELSNFMGQTSVESMRFTRLEERFGYSSVGRVIDNARGILNRQSLEDIEDAVASRDPERVANAMYDGHPGLRNTEAGDGWRFRGRGVIQLTGRYNYEHFGRKIGVDLVEAPDLAKDPEVSADIAVAYWKERVRDIDPTDIRAATKKVNGGYNAYDERVAAAERWAEIITPELIEGIRQKSVAVDDLLAMSTAPPAQTHAALRHGDRGDDVLNLQTELHNLGYAVQPDGAFGNATRNAVMAFQQNHGLAADGIAGPKTLASAASAHELLQTHPGPYAADSPSAPREITRDSSIHDMFEALCHAASDRNLDALCHVGRTYSATPAGQGVLAMGELHNQRAMNESLATQQAQAQVQAEQQQGPVMSRGSAGGP